MTFTLKIKPTEKQKLAWEKLRDKETQFILYGGAAGTGKAQPLNSKILTVNGFKSMGCLNIGDKLITPNNEEAKVIAIHLQGKKDIYEITFIDGAKIRTTKNHLFDCWIAQKGQERRKLRTVEEIQKIKGNVIIPLSDPLKFGIHYEEVDSYTIGALIGDGGTTKNEISFTTADKEIFDYLDFQQCAVNKKKKYAYSITANLRDKNGYGYNPFMEKLRKIGIMSVITENKKVPDVILKGSLKNRIDCLQGLMDTDGTVDSNGIPSFCSKSEQLARDVQYLVRSIGGKATLRKKNKFCWYNGAKKYCLSHDVYIRTKDDSNLFRLKRKKERCKLFNGGVSELGRRIISIEKVANEEAQCITIDKEHGLYISDDFVVTHNSWLGSEFLISHAIGYPDTKWFIGRNELKRIMRSTYITFEKACKFHNIPSTCWKLDSKYNFIKFWNGSRIELLDLSYQPRDPLYERFGSEEYTGGWIEEAGEVKEKAFDVLKSRIGRQHNEFYGLYPKMLLTCNPKKNWLYFLFYNPWRQDELPKDSVFIPALYYDNPFTSEQYGEMLSKIRDPVMRARLKEGKWEYDDEEGAMMSYNKILEMFDREPVFSPEDERFLSVDVARFGRDNSVFILWQGYHIERIWEYDKSSTVFVEDKIRSICNQYKMDYHNVVVDSDGVGGGVVDHLPGVYAFVNGGRPITEYDDDKKYRDQETDRFFYANLRAQCYDRLSTYVNEGVVSCNPDINTETRNMVIQELEVIKKKDVEKNEKKVQIIPKEEIKDTIGRSPDYGDAIMQRMVFGLGDPRETMEDQGEIAVVW